MYVSKHTREKQRIRKMKDKVIFATGNAGKMKEVRLILADLGKEILSMDEAGFKGDIEENGTTFAENAESKSFTRSSTDRSGFL